jgi:uncharacterized membrane protein
MKIKATIITSTLLAVLLLTWPVYEVHAQSFVQYKVQVSLDGSAVWTVTQASSINGIIDTWQGFQQRVTNLISSAVNQTQREMSLDNNSLQMNTIWETQSHTTEYQFTWLNFSIIQVNEITFGDVFQVKDFFSQLYGDGVIKVFYPSTYLLQSVSPKPNGGDTDPKTLDWLGTQFFINGNPSVILTASSSSPSPTPDQNVNDTSLQLYALAGASSIAVASSLVGFYKIRRRKRKISEIAKLTFPVGSPALESEEEKIIKVIQASGGSAYQSAIVEKCRFSKAKTSQLLTALEKRGVLRRYKKGRDKIVTLTVPINGETP